MHESLGKPARHLRPWVALAALFAVVVAVGLWIMVERVHLRSAAEEGRPTLRIAVDGLTNTLDRFEPLPTLIAERPILSQLLRDPQNQGLLPFVNEQLRLTAFTLGVSDVYLMDVGGTTIAASNYRDPQTFLGANFAYRPYFQQAIEGGLGRYFARGTTSGRRGYFFAAPVLDTTRIIGVLAVKFEVAPFEEAWQDASGEIVVTDLADVIFMSSRPDWRFRTLSALSTEDRERIERDRQYPMDALRPLDTTFTEANGFSRAAVDGVDYVSVSEFIPSVGWTVRHFIPASAARTRAAVAFGYAVLLLTLALLVAQIVRQRMARAREREHERLTRQAELEARVRQRTADLADANERLTVEIEERKSTEDRLRRTQKELVQAGKLAALGQMSAALSHEINQPLTAVKSYADNASAFLDRGRVSDARSNVALISEMADRMADLSGHLRNFARRPGDVSGPVDVRLVVADALSLFEPRLRRERVAVSNELGDDPIWVLGGRLRLQQVFVNLIGNALDAMETSPAPHLGITAEVSSDRITIRLQDNGSGISEDALGGLFDPFFTTKAQGKGLGLGLSISYNIVEDFGGHLSAGNRSEGGAWFAVTLERTAATEVAAE